MRCRVIWTLLFAMSSLAVPLASGQASEGQTRPNILFIILDDWGANHASVHGVPWISTPNIDRVAREGVIFSNCFTNNPKCSPCRASILTGRNTWQLAEACNHFGVFPHRWPVYTELLEQAGYHVGYTGKGWGPGDYRAGGFEENPAGKAYNRRRTQPPQSGISNIDYAANFADFLQDRKEGQPFCFWLGPTEPHLPYEQGAGRRAGKDPSTVQLPAYYPDSNVIRNDFLDYATEVEWADVHIGRALKLLEETGELDNTVIVITSDHGPPLPRMKGQIYEHGFHIPLYIRWGAVTAGGRTVEDFINVRDFAPTFLELAGVEIPQTVTGTSFLYALRSDKSGWIDPSRNWVVVGKERHDIGRPYDQGYPVRAIRTTEWLYILNYHPERWPVGNPETVYRNCDASPTKWLLLSRFDDYYRLNFGKRPREELYHVATDPDCVKNLASDPRYRRTKVLLREQMLRELRRDRDPRVFGNGEVFETYQYVGRRTHSYDAWLEHSR